MTDLQKLLHAIYVDPFDELARLAYADWLEENGDRVERKYASLLRLLVAPPRAAWTKGQSDRYMEAVGDAELDALLFGPRGSKKFGSKLGRGIDVYGHIVLDGALHRLLGIGEADKLFWRVPCRVAWVYGIHPLGGKKWGCSRPGEFRVERKLRCCLPEEVFARLEGGKMGREYRSYRTSVEAMKAAAKAVSDHLHYKAMGIEG